MNAYIGPSVEKYLASLDGQMRSLGIPSIMHVMQSNGGVLSSTAAAKMPIKTLLSGPVGGTIGGKALSNTLHRPNLICVDMGGTSFDMSIIKNGEPIVRSETQLQGIPLLLPVIDVHTIGAGGGSLAWLDGDALRVGPQSAGADPGPACYGHGGTAPTITDANLFLKRINPLNFLGGQIILDEECAASALNGVARKLGIDSTKLAEGMINIINSKMANAIRTITIEHGIDPRSFSLVAFGGAGPMHAVWLAQDLQIPEVIVPWYPGTFSAWGMLQTDIRQDLATSYYTSLTRTDLDRVRTEFDKLEKEGEELLREEGVQPSDMSSSWFADMRYMGQEHSVLVPLDHNYDLSQIGEAYHRTYHAKFGHSSPEDPVEFVNLRIAAYGAIRKKDTRLIPQSQSGKNLTVEYREVVFDGIPLKTKILDRNCLKVKSRFQGPLIMEEETATTVVPPGYILTIDKLGNAVITRSRTI
jgi:N-methylhydantoinase A